MLARRPRLARCLCVIAPEASSKTLQIFSRQLFDDENLVFFLGLQPRYDLRLRSGLRNGLMHRQRLLSKT